MTISVEPAFADWSRDIAMRMEEVLAGLLPAASATPGRLHEAMRYSTLGGGKRVRAMLAHAAGRVTSAPADRVGIVASAVELIHAYSLIHDDLPCMDDDVLRRGKPTCHVEFDEATALLAGDALQALAFQLVSEYKLCDDPLHQLKLIETFAHACGSRGMAGGQAVDLGNVGKEIALPELEFMHILKTGALIRASVLMGAACGQPITTGQQAALDRYAQCVGLAFQVVDDILDCEASTESLGKTAGKDQEQGKPTYVSLMGLPGAKSFAVELLADADTALAVFDGRAARLRELAAFIVNRHH
ncbi:MAG: polyprenyl synthetase family protein [Betaproteobacteria bacterium]|nr:polyprenyl synthetase family protein [Betaproteobacteria bacterium]